jgi:hypothetical protein
MLIGELDGSAVSALGVRTWKLSNVCKSQLWMGDQNLLFRAPLCFGRHVKLLVPAALAVIAPYPVSRRVDVRQIAGRKSSLPNLYHNKMKNMCRPHLVG